VKIPVVSIMCVYLVAGAGAIGFMDTTLAIYLQNQVKKEKLLFFFKSVINKHEIYHMESKVNPH